MEYSVPLMEAHQSKYSVKEFLKKLFFIFRAWYLSLVQNGGKTEENLNRETALWEIEMPTNNEMFVCNLLHVIPGM